VPELVLSEPVLVAPAGDRIGAAAIGSADERTVCWRDINRFLSRRYRLETGRRH
jgi:hypothetical protein